MKRNIRLDGLIILVAVILFSGEIVEVLTLGLDTVKHSYQAAQEVGRVGHEIIGCPRCWSDNDEY